MSDILFTNKKIVLTPLAASILVDKLTSALKSLKDCPNASSVTTIMHIPKEDEDSIKIEIVINKE